MKIRTYKLIRRALWIPIVYFAARGCAAGLESQGKNPEYETSLLEDEVSIEDSETLEGVTDLSSYYKERLEETPTDVTSVYKERLEDKLGGEENEGYLTEL